MEFFIKNLKRPLAHFGMVFSVGLAVALLFSWKAAAAAAMLCLVLLVYLALFKNQRVALGSVVVVYMAAFILSGTYGCFVSRERQQVTGLLNNTIPQAVITITGEKSSTGLVYAKVDEVSGNEIKGVSVCFYAEGFEPGDRLLAKIPFTEPGKYMRSTDRLALYYADGIEVLERFDEIDSDVWLRSRIRSLFIRRLSFFMDNETAAIVGALITGETGSISEGARRRMSIAGVAHILAVSGLHISAIAAAMAWLLRKLGFGDIPVFLATAAALVASADFFGGSPSVIRAVCMACYVYSARAAGRLPDHATSISLASVMVLLGNPYAVLSSSYLLSFGCVASLMLVYPKVVAARKQLFSLLARLKLRRIAEALTASLVIQIITFPILLAFNIPLSIISGVTNLVLLPFVPMLMLLAFFTVVFFPIPVLGDIFGIGAGFLGKAMVKIIDAVASLPNVSVRLDTPRSALIAVAIAASLLVLLLAKNGRLCLASLAVLVFAAAATFILPVFTVVMHSYNAYISSGRSSAVIVRDADADNLSDIAYAQTTGYAGEVRYAIILDKTYNESDVAAAFPKAAIIDDGGVDFGKITLQVSENGVLLKRGGNRVLLCTENGDSSCDAIMVLDGDPSSIPESQLSAVPYWLSYDGDVVYVPSDIVTLNYSHIFGYYLGRSGS